ncbi:Do family serine endopeptidase [Azoarcus sp. L1K30]|uniref:Do family serine endopeptidase n=1 Tax=Azoarcus sp. L1K30 TaxID=2820277 RepID=UPI001B80F408|nr:Do family serine endopeptidase [Azoarcus sp. L1K30]MBR0565709.1 Do family serine endopeptidase [Azoarcus sp. L1K30]
MIRSLRLVLLGVLVCVSTLSAWAVDSLPDFTALVARQGAAVVNISAISSASQKGQAFPGLDESDPMFDFFRRIIPRHRAVPKEDPDNESLGSGFIISSDGYILTNAHVVEDADEILVRLADKREYRAQVVGADSRSDVALIRIEAKELPRIILGDPSKLKVGEWVLAIGSPFGFEQTVTAGIVSAKDRSLPDENFVPFIQTDVAINPGNSGGPLFNLRGEVVGINSQIYSRTGGFMGLSFAIPIDVAMDVQQQLRTTGRIQRGRIGVAIQEVTVDLAASFGLPRAAGALVSAVEPNSPAARAGIERGDVIMRFDNRNVERSSDLPRIVASNRPGTNARMMVYRGGAAQEMNVTLGEWRDPKPSRPRMTSALAGTGNSLGLLLIQAPLTRGRDQGDAAGLIVDRLEGPAARSSLQVGDAVLAVILAGKQTKLTTVDSFEQLVRELKEGQQLSLLVQRGEVSSYISLRAGK